MALLLLMVIVAPSPGSDQTEVCDGMDNDGDGLVDEGVRRVWYRPAEKGDTCREVTWYSPIPPEDKIWRCDCPYGYVPACTY